MLSVEPFIHTFGIGDLPAGCKGIFLFLRYSFFSPWGFVLCFKIRFLFVYDNKTLPVFAFGQRESPFPSLITPALAFFEFYLCACNAVWLSLTVISTGRLRSPII